MQPNVNDKFINSSKNKHYESNDGKYQDIILIGPKLNGCFASIILPFMLSHAPAFIFIFFDRLLSNSFKFDSCFSYIVIVRSFLVVFLKTKKAYSPTEVSQLLKVCFSSDCTFFAFYYI